MGFLAQLMDLDKGLRKERRKSIWRKQPISVNK
jgi:hypothetical protein